MNYYMSNFTMAQFYHYSLSELDDMYPWEREVYMTLLNKHIEEENERRKNAKNKYCKYKFIFQFEEY